MNNHKGFGFQKDDNEQVSTPYTGSNEQNDEDNKNPQGVKFLRRERRVIMCKGFCKART